MHAPGVVPEVPTDPTDDGRHNEPNEWPLTRVIAVDRSDQAQPGDLDQIFAGLSPPDEAVCDVVGQRHTAGDDPAAPLPAFLVIGSFGHPDEPGPDLDVIVGQPGVRRGRGRDGPRRFATAQGHLDPLLRRGRAFYVE
jgi:hypothetical protein